MNKTPVTVKVYLKKFEVEALDRIAKRAKISRSGLVALLLRQQIKAHDE